ncbi:MAG: VCBS repeat-containing protein [Anaerolineales bacterium]|nr:VCBS repeat-containing protein [Anaerolineales bacterium]
MNREGQGWARRLPTQAALLAWLIFALTSLLAACAGPDGSEAVVPATPLASPVPSLLAPSPTIGVTPTASAAPTSAAPPTATLIPTITRLPTRLPDCPLPVETGPLQFAPDVFEKLAYIYAPFEQIAETELAPAIIAYLDGGGDPALLPASLAELGLTAQLVWLNLDGRRDEELVLATNRGYWIFGCGTGRYHLQYQSGFGYDNKLFVESPGDINGDGRPDLLISRQVWLSGGVCYAFVDIMGRSERALVSWIKWADISPQESWPPSDCSMQSELQADEDNPDQQRLIVHGNTGPCFPDDPNRPFTRIFALADDGYFHLVEMIYGEPGEPGGCSMPGSWLSGDD